MELLPTSSTALTSDIGPFRQETGEDEESCYLLQHALLENPESETRWYFKYFLGKVHYNYLCYDNSKSPLFLSVMRSESAASTYRCILWKKTGNKRLYIEPGAGGKVPSPRYILEKFSGSKYERSIKELSIASIQKDLLTLEEQEGSVNFKFGVLYAKAGQKTDNEMFSNENGSERFQKFVELLGEEVGLEGWPQFKGGLDNKNNSTGKTSVYTVFEGHEIMFHVSTLLPYSTGNEQQLERKRHIGNDIVVIIFVDYDTNPEEAIQAAMNFNPQYMHSHFNHIFALVTYDGIANRYRVNVCSAESVPFFGPPLPCFGEFNDHISFRDFLLAKLINGEKAAYCTPTFAEKRQRTLDLLLKSVEQKCTHEYRRAVSSPSLHHVPQSPLTPANKKLFEREQIFADFGQRLKVEKIIRGHHPTSQRTTVATKKDPWRTECIVNNFPYQITYGDVCDDGTLIVTTQNDGTYFIYRDGSYSLIIDKSVPIAQLVVAHRHQMLLLRTAYSKESNYLYVIPLKEFYTEKITVGVRSSLNLYHIPYTKGCHLFCTAPLDGQFLRLAVAVKTKIIMMAYKYPATLTVNGSPLTPLRSPNPMDSFIKHRELTLVDVPMHMALPDERPGKLCVSYNKQTAVDAIDEVMGGVQKIPNLDTAKAKLTTLTGTCTNGKSELLIGYNLTCQLITINDSSAYNSVEIVWNAEPRNLVYMPPYLLAFTASTIEIRMASNGSLMQTIPTPDLKLISMKEDVYFSSSSSMIQNPISKTHSSSVTNLPAKFPKNIDKKDFLTSGTYDHKNMTFIYKISFEDMTGRRESMTETPLRNSVSYDSMSTGYSITEDERRGVYPSALDDVHPIMEDEEQGLISSFGDKSKDELSALEDDGPDYDHLDSPISLKSLQGFQTNSPEHSPFSPVDSESDYDHIAPLESPIDLKSSPQSFRDYQKLSSSPPTNREPGSRAIRRRGIVTGKRPGYTKTPGDQSPGRNRGGGVFNTTPETLPFQSSSPDSGVQDDFAATANNFNSSIANHPFLSNRRTNVRHHS
ncbi:GTPase-activating Rap/Ran-GAP domain-like protein 3 isoform X3 [Halichondria panicea]